MRNVFVFTFSRDKVGYYYYYYVSVRLIVILHSKPSALLVYNPGALKNVNEVIRLVSSRRTGL